MSKTRNNTHLKKYPWDKWFSRRTFVLKKTTEEVEGDYSCQTHGMAQQVRNEARRRGVSVSIAMHEGSLEVQTSRNAKVK